MKKAFLVMAALLSILTLNGCANKKTESEPEFSNSPFSGSNSESASEPQADSYEELFGKYQTGSFKIGNYSLDDSMEIEYNGGDIEFSFDVSTSGNKYEVEKGFMAFINGIPQKLSLNGGERNELVRISQQPDQSSTATLSFTPTITEDMIGEQTLQVKIISIFNPSYEPSGSFVGFGNAHNGQPFVEFDIKVNSPLAVSEDVFEPIKDECESVLITDETAKQYGISKPGEGTATNVSIKNAQTKGEPLALRGGGLDAELLMYGSETYNYRVYFYVNHERVKFNGGDYLETEVKSGYLNVLKPELENIKERNIIYAVAIPMNSETGSMTVRKSASVLVLNENDVPGNNSDVQTPVESQPELPPETSGNEQPEFDGITDIYSYQPEGYIDDEQRYLLLSRHTFHTHDTEYHDLIIYDDVAKEVTGVLDVEDESFPYVSYGEGVVLVEVYHPHQALDNDENPLRYVVYNERFEPIREVYQSDISDIYYPYSLRYLPSQKRWYFNSDDCFYSANEDFSEPTRISDHELYQYYVLDDRIVYYQVIADYDNPENNADILGVMDLDGNIISETVTSTSGEGRFRLRKAGDMIYIMSGFRFEPYSVIETSMDGMIFYDYKTGEQKTFHPETENENTFCMVTPNGKYLVTGILDMENHYTINDITIKLYDIESGELLESEALGTGDRWFLAMSAYNDRVMLKDGSSVTYMFKTQ